MIQPRPPMGVDAVLFDIDDTLIQTRAAWIGTMAAIADRYLPALPPGGAQELAIKWREDPNGHFARYAAGELSYLEQRRLRANEMHVAYGGEELDQAGFAEWDKVFDTAFRAGFIAHPDAVEALAALSDAGIPFGAASNGPVAYQADKLAVAGLDVPMLVGIDTLGVGKPAKEFFLEGCRRLGTEPARTVYVGDEFYIDAVAARDAGLRALWVDRPGHRRDDLTDTQVLEADFPSMASLDGLLDILMEL
jgi:putative hydrolase of the HAD superfamily